MKKYTNAEARVILTLTPRDSDLVGTVILYVTDQSSSSANIDTDGRFGDGCVEANIYSLADIVLVIVDERFTYPGRPEWINELARFGPFESVKAAREFIAALKRIIAGDHQGESITLSLQQRFCGPWAATAWKVGGKWLSKVEFREIGRAESAHISDEFGPFEYKNQATLVALGWVMGR